MRLLTEAAGQVLTRNVAADRAGFSSVTSSVESCKCRKGTPVRSMPMAIFVENRSEDARPYTPWHPSDVNVVISRLRHEKGHNISMAEAALSLWLRTVRN